MKRGDTQEKQWNEHGAAITYHQLGRMASEQQDLARAGELTIKSIMIFSRLDDHHSLRISIRALLRCLESADAQTRKALREQWQATTLGKQIDLMDLEKPFREHP